MHTPVGQTGLDHPLLTRLYLWVLGLAWFANAHCEKSDGPHCTISTPSTARMSSSSSKAGFFSSIST